MSSGPPDTRSGISFDVAVSGFVKEMRRSREENALRFAIDLAESGFEQHVWKRIVIFVSEDVGIAQPELAPQVWALHEMAEWLKKVRKDDPARPWRLHLIEAVILCVRARKSRICDHALIALYSEAAPPEVQPYHLDKHTLAGKRAGASWRQFWSEGTLLANAETGELEVSPHLQDHYRARAMRATGGGR